MAQKIVVKTLYVLINLFLLIGLILLWLYKLIILEAMQALMLLVILANSLLLWIYFFHLKLKRLAKSLGFEFLTRFLEQPRMEGIYKKNWWQIHYASRDYGEYWGVPRTYVKLQYKEKHSFDKKILQKYTKHDYKGMTLIDIDHITRPYKDYLLMRVKWYITDKVKLKELMDLLLEISKEAKSKKYK